MGQIKPPAPALLLLAAFSRHEAALAWALRRAASAWGEPILSSPPFDFRETEYYTASMGPELTKQFWLFNPSFDPATLPSVKRQTNLWEEEYAAVAALPEPRPLNLDPGYLTMAKLVLASTKDHAHRIYLADGIYAEITLHYTGGRWQGREWTFADYRRDDYHQFFLAGRAWLHARQRQEHHA